MSHHTIHFFCGLTTQTAQVLREQCLSAITNGATELTILISSVGGSLHEGFSLYHFLKSLPVKPTIYNVGSVESAAVIVYLGGHNRLISSTGRIMFHPWTWGFGAANVEIPRIREALHSLEVDMKRFSDLIGEATKGIQTPFDVSSTFYNAKIISPGEAVAHGMAHKIKEVTTPVGSVLWWVNQ